MTIYGQPQHSYLAGFYIRLWSTKVSQSSEFECSRICKREQFFYAKFKFSGIFTPAKIWEFYFSEQRYIIYHFNQNFMQNSIPKVIYFINVKLGKNCSWIFMFQYHSRYFIVNWLNKASDSNFYSNVKFGFEFFY